MSSGSAKTGENLLTIHEDFGVCPKQPKPTEIDEDTSIVPSHPSAAKSSGLPELTPSVKRIQKMRNLGL